MLMLGRKIAVVIAPMFALACAACSLLVDHGATQCQTDSDCAHFGTQPDCHSGLCVASGLGPVDCFEGTPQKASDFLNQCSAAQCLSFDNCQRLGECGDAGTAGGGLVTPPAPEAGTTSTSMASQSDAGPPVMPSCADPNDGRGQVVYLTGSSNFPPLLAKLAPMIIATGYTPVYQVTNSCTGVGSVFNAATINDPNPVPGAKYAAYFNADGTSVPCTLGPDGASVDVGESDIFSTTCDGFGPPTGNIGEYLGPIQAIALVVPGKSQEVAISAEAARAVFGMGGDNDAAAPWTDPTQYFVRNASTGTQQMVGQAINVPPNEFWGIDRGSAANVDAQLRLISNATLAEQSIGIISTDYYDTDRANLKALAFKAVGQDCAYLPDSTPFKTDKQNVRDGHYPIWGPLHFFTAISNDGDPVTPGAQAFVSVVSVPNLAKPLIDAFIGSSLVPSCAMSVQRSTELGQLSVYTAPYQCGCYFEESVNGVKSEGCTPCVTATECTDPTHPACNLGFCERQ